MARKKKQPPTYITPLQHKFILEYVAEIGASHDEGRRTNATAAALRAGYAESSSKAMASRLLKDERIKTQIDAEIDMALGSERAVLRHNLLREFQALGFSDMGHFLDDDNNVLPKSQWPKGASRVVSEVITEVSEDGKVKTKIKLLDKHKNLALLAKYAHVVEDKPQKIELDISLTSQEEQDATLKELLSKME